MSEHPEHPNYSALSQRWTYAWDVYSGEYAYPNKITNYLIRRKQGEHPNAYQERKNQSLADPALDMAAVVDSLTGMLFGNPEKVSRTWRETNDEGQATRDFSLGDPQDEEARAYRLRRNIDGQGMSLPVLNKHVATRLTVKHTVWGLADGAIYGDGDTVVRPPIGTFIEPEAVVNWREDNRGRLVEVLKIKQEDPRESVFDDTEEGGTNYIHYTLDGWQEVNSDGEPQGPRNDYSYYSGTEVAEEDRVLPIFRQELTLPRDVGYLMARKCAALFNMESELDAYGRLTNLPRLGLVSNQTGKQFEELVDDVAAGESILQLPVEGNTHQYLVPPAEHMESRAKRLTNKRKDFYAQSFREYGQAGREATATEMRQTWAAGVAAFLTHLARAVESFERKLFRRLEQAEFADQPAAWGQHSITRNPDVSPKDSLEVLQSAVQRMFGTGNIPAPTQAKAQVLADWLDELGQDVDLEDVVEAVEEAEDRSAQAAAQGRSLL